MQSYNWAIENRLHWVIDTGFGEDHSRVRDRNAAANLAVLRRIALNLVRADCSRPGSLKGKRKLAGWDDVFMHRLVAASGHALALGVITVEKLHYAQHLMANPSRSIPSICQELGGVRPSTLYH